MRATVEGELRAGLPTLTPAGVGVPTLDPSRVMVRELRRRARRHGRLQPYVSELGCSRMCRARRRGRLHDEAALGREQLHPRELEGGAVLRHVRPRLLQQRERTVRIHL